MSTSISKSGKSETVIAAETTQGNLQEESLSNAETQPVATPAQALLYAEEGIVLPVRSVESEPNEHSLYPIERSSFESLTVNQRKGVILQTLNLDARDFRKFTDAVTLFLKGSELPSVVFERTLAWLIAEAESGICFNDEKSVIEVAEIKQKWTDHVPLLAIAEDLQNAVRVAIEEKKWNLGSDVGRLISAEGLFSRMRSALRPSFGSPLNTAYSSAFFSEVLMCKLLEILTDDHVSNLYQAIELTIAGRAVLIHEPVIEEILQALDAFQDQEYSIDPHKLLETRKLHAELRKYSFNIGLADDLGPEENFNIARRYMGSDAPSWPAIQNLIDANHELLRYFITHGFPSGEKLEFWQGVLRGSLQDAICKPKESNRPVFNFMAPKQSLTSDVLALLGHTLDNHDELALAVDRMSKPLLNFVFSDRGGGLFMSFPSNPEERWIETAEKLLGFDGKLLREAFKGSISQQTSLGGGFEWRAKHGVIWWPSASSLDIPLVAQILADPERPIKLEDVLNEEEAKPLIKRLGGPVFLILLEEGVSMTVSQWAKLARKVHETGPCSLNRSIHRYRVELGFLDLDEKGAETPTLNAGTAADQHAFLEWAETFLYPQDNRQRELLRSISTSSAAIEGLNKLRSYLPELTDLGEARAIDLLEAVYAATQGDCSSLFEVLTKRECRKELLPLRSVLFSCLNEQAKSLIRKYINPELEFSRPAIGAPLTVEDLSLSELINKTSWWLELREFSYLAGKDRTTAYSDSSIETERPADNLSKVRTEAGQLLSMLMDDDESSLSQPSISRWTASYAPLGHGLRARWKIHLNKAAAEVRRVRSMLKDIDATKTLTKIVLNQEQRINAGSGLTPLGYISLSGSEYFSEEENSPFNSVGSWSDRGYTFSYYGKEGVFHEVGHHIEYSVPGVFHLCEAFRAKRVEPNVAAIPLNQLKPEALGRYGEHEVAYKGNFIDHYVGKICLGKATEVYSMGLEQFANPEALSAFALKDNEHFLLILGVILRCRGEI